MSDVSRREALRLGAGLAVGGGLLAGRDVLGDEPAKDEAPKEAKPVEDWKLKSAQENPEAFMFTQEITFKSSTTDPYTQFVKISPVKGSRQGYEEVLLPIGSMRIFRAYADKDEFTRKGGLYWKCGKSEGKIQFSEPGELVMAVRDRDGTVRCYSLEFDLRC